MRKHRDFEDLSKTIAKAIVDESAGHASPPLPFRQTPATPVVFARRSTAQDIVDSAA